MKQYFNTVYVDTRGPGLYDFTCDATRIVAASDIANGLLTCFIHHTSASLLVQENADPNVLVDLEHFMQRLVSRDTSLYRHTAEGSDDMPAHIRAALTAVSVSIPVRARSLVLGTWQGLYLFEHRDRAHRRAIELHIIGE